MTGVMKRLLDPRKYKYSGEYPFQYTPSYATDIRKTFERARRAQQPANVVTLPRKERT